MKSTLSYFHSSLIVTVLGLIGGAWVEYLYMPTTEGVLTGLFLTAVLAVLEISLSFDNAVVNASVLNQMTPIWRHRFITWGMLIAVFGMRIVFPLGVVSLAAGIGPWQALMLATFKQREYADIMMSAHLSLAGFGGTFLLLVCLAYFFNEEKQTHWLSWLEKPLSHAGRLPAAEIGLTLILLLILIHQVPGVKEQVTLLEAGLSGTATFIFVEGLSSVLKVPGLDSKAMAKTSAALFLYLEVLDASFSFDGVIGAFALTTNLFIIAIGLGIGAMFVRSLTILMVDKKTLSEFIFLEHGAFYAIGALALTMLMDIFIHVPEVVTGLIGAGFIALSFWSSLRHRKGKVHA